MKRIPYPVKIKNFESGQDVEAMVFSPLNDKNIEDYHRLWKPEFYKAKEKLIKEGIKIEDSHWDWGKKIEYIKGMLAYKSFALEVENITQGMMIIETVQFSKIEANKHLVYIEYLATAPWNRKIIVEKPKYKKIGSVLVAIIALLESFSKGYNGRIGLFSLPQACLFYEKLGFEHIGNITYREMKYYELSKKAAAKLMKKLKKKE